MPTKSKYFSANLKRARSALGLSTIKMADYLGLSSGQTYRNYEEGRVPQDKEVLQQIANKLKTSPEEIISTIVTDPDAVMMYGPPTDLPGSVREPVTTFGKPRTIEDRLDSIEQLMKEMLSEVRKGDKA